MTKNELLMKIQAQLGNGLSLKDIDHVLQTLGDVTQAALANGDEVTLPCLGKLSVIAKPERQDRNPATGETMTIAAKRAPKFSVSKALKDAVNI